VEELEERELYARVGVSHPNGAGTVTLFHGTDAAGAALLAAGVDLSRTRGTGDFNHSPGTRKFHAVDMNLRRHQRYLAVFILPTASGSRRNSLASEYQVESRLQLRLSVSLLNI
jgi:hypothetical protein